MSANPGYWTAVLAGCKRSVRVIRRDEHIELRCLSLYAFRWCCRHLGARKRNGIPIRVLDCHSERKHCWGAAKEQHVRGCRPGRPLCRWRRNAKGLCHCEAYHYAHQHGSGNCLRGSKGSEKFYEMLNRPMRGGVALCG